MRICQPAASGKVPLDPPSKIGYKRSLPSILPGAYHDPKLHMLLRLLDSDFMGSTRMAFSGNLLNMRAMLGLCLIIGVLLTGWLFTWLMLRWPARSRGDDRHNRGARVIDRDDE